MRHLPPEPWGSQMRRARDLAGLTLQDATDEIARVVTTSTARISRLESLESAPQDWGRRAFAASLLVTYDFNPADFDLSYDDIPAGVLSELVCAAGDSDPEPADSRHGRLMGVRFIMSPRATPDLPRPVRLDSGSPHDGLRSAYGLAA